jgi:tRNA (cmo5U34)-methyltransferase
MQNGDWGSQASQTFIDYGRYFVPNREYQLNLIAGLIPLRPSPFQVLELCCGEGLLAAAILERHPQATLLGYDGSPEMLAAAGLRLAPFGSRFQPRQFDLADHGWRRLGSPVHAVVSSLAIHHLNDEGKARLFRDVYGMLEPGGVFIIADLMRPATPLGWQAAATEWDAAVRERGQQLDGDPARALALFEAEKWNMYRHFDPTDIDQPSTLFNQLQWLVAAGFSAVDVFWMRAGHAIFGGKVRG